VTVVGVPVEPGGEGAGKDDGAEPAGCPAEVVATAAIAGTNRPSAQSTSSRRRIEATLPERR
jgi:hypothetical protein